MTGRLLLQMIRHVWPVEGRPSKDSLKRLKRVLRDRLEDVMRDYSARGEKVDCSKGRVRVLHKGQEAC